RIMIAGAGSGAGKSTISLGLMAALAGRGLDVRPFKSGPDYIDPGLHRAACGRVSHNLDPWLMPEKEVRDLFRRHAPDRASGLAVIEGAMGLFDGQGAGAFASSAHAACLIDSPLLLVINAQGMGLSAAALAGGFASFRPRQAPEAPSAPDLSALRVAGVILNRVSGTRHAALLRRVFAEHSSLPCLGCLPNNAVPPLPERHLGLTPATELPHLAKHIAILAGAIEEHIDLPALLALARSATALPDNASEAQVPASFAGLRLGLAMDAAFSFYYRDGLDLLEEMGAELVPFSPLADGALPPGLHGLLLGGGFPEMFAQELANNASMLNSLRAALEAGLPAYAECGGMLYLCASLKATGLPGSSGSPGSPGAPTAGEERPMAAFFPQKARMTSALQPFGYVELDLRRDCLLGRAGQRIRAHEFHYSLLENPDGGACGQGSGQGAGHSPLYTALRPDGRSWSGGLTRKNCVAWYPHLHFRGHPEAARSFLMACDAFRHGLSTQ
ncbi:cobyrinate a,c-diamide synthase, partial [Desulfovibrio sp. OttesenSCG-928-G11]|nr:cobyrinate a,c-diamide synthase [Desulfovibrio sp. OttesenSCG-928-G11]